MAYRLTFNNGDSKVLDAKKVGSYLVVMQEISQELEEPIVLEKIEILNTCENCNYTGDQIFCPVCIQKGIEEMIEHIKATW